MRYRKRSFDYIGSNGRWRFDVRTMRAFSYDWWQFVAFIGGKVYFNDYYYSSTTGSHQRNVRRLLRQAGVKTTSVYYAAGLQNLSGQVTNFENEISTLESEIATPRSHARKNEERRAQIKQLRVEIKRCRKLAKQSRAVPTKTANAFRLVFERLEAEKAEAFARLNPEKVCDVGQVLWAPQRGAR